MSSPLLIILRNRKGYCPHCKVYVGVMQNEALNVGFVRLAERTHTLQCVKCAEVFVYRKPGPKPVIISQIPPAEPSAAF